VYAAVINAKRGHNDRYIAVITSVHNRCSTRQWQIKNLMGGTPGCNSSSSPYKLLLSPGIGAHMDRRLCR